MPAALGARRYSRNDRLVLKVSDHFCEWNNGRCVLDDGPEGVECRPAAASPDLAMSAGELAAAYLGAVEFTTLAYAGRVEERTPGSLARAGVMFAAWPKPWCTYMF